MKEKEAYDKWNWKWLHATWMVKWLQDKWRMPPLESSQNSQDKTKTKRTSLTNHSHTKMCRVTFLYFIQHLNTKREASYLLNEEPWRTSCGVGRERQIWCGLGIDFSQCRTIMHILESRVSFLPYWTSHRPNPITSPPIYAI